MRNILVLYHSNCPDGFGAAWVLWKKFGKKAEYIAIDPRELPKISFRNKDIFILDNSFASKVIENLEKIGKSVMIIDHHKSSEKDVKSAPNYVFDLNHSASILAWIFFNLGKKAPLFLKYIEDLDLWRFKMAGTKIFDSLLEIYDYDFRTW
ncbi:MAG: DHH family phosphoesterase, partial [Patescibacteria group bacterium]|nr:DHH family phosphoesterase [Patescibacteria group bacterium]